MIKQNLAIIIEFGFHEIKKFIHSGFAARLGECFEIYWLVLDKNEYEIEAQLSQWGKVIFVAFDNFESDFSRLESLSRISSEAWMRNRGIPLFHNTRKQPIRKKGDLILGNSVVKKLLNAFALYIVQNSYLNNAIKNTLEVNKISHVIGISCTSTFAKTIFTTAQHLNKKTFYLVNSWKDLYTNPFLPFRKFSKIFVWNQQMKNDYLKICSYLEEKMIVVTGNPSFDPYIGYVPKRPKKYYAQKYSLDENKQWFYYTMMPPGLWNNEIDHIITLSQELKQKLLNIEILIRRNPNHEKNEFSDLNLNGNCILTEHYTKYHIKKDLIFQSEEGEHEWMDLVYHSDANISIPSTVTLEFLALGKHVFNLAFSASGKFPESLKQHFDSGFYHPLFEHNDRLHHIINLNQFVKEIQFQVKKFEQHNLKKASDLIFKNLI